MEDGKNKPLLAEVFEIPFLEQTMASSPVPVYSYLLAPVTVATPGMHQERSLIFTHCWKARQSRTKLCIPKSCKDNWLSASSQLVLLWPPLVSALSGKTFSWPGRSYSQACEQRQKRLHRDVMKTGLQRHEGVLPAWGGYAVTLTRLLPRDFLMASGIGHMTPGNAACVSEVMSKHPEIGCLAGEEFRLWSVKL